MLRNTLNKAYSRALGLLRCNKGASSELLANVAAIVTSVLARAQTLFATIGAPTP